MLANRTRSSIAKSETRHVADLAGVLGATTATTAGTAVLHLGNIHGDIALQLPLDATKSPVVLDADEYGNPREAQQPTRYTWNGVHQRSTETPTGLTLMGARLYDPGYGRFLSTDPIYGGNENAYNYPADPVNMADISGMESKPGPRQALWCAAHVWYCATQQSKDVAYARQYANALAAKYGFNRSITDAFQHFIWMFLAAAHVSRKGAIALGNAHEIDSPGKANDTRRDKMNNSRGAREGGAYRSSGRSRSDTALREAAVKAAWAYFNRGDLWCPRGKTKVAACHR